MDTNLKSGLEVVCRQYESTLNDLLLLQGNSTNSGICYLTGHCLSQGLSKRGFTTKETTGVLFLKNKNDKFLIYGPDNYERQGLLVGNYHTWCVLETNDEEIIIDPTISSMKSYLKESSKIKVHDKVPNYIITTEKINYYYKYITDDRLIYKSKSFLDRISTDTINLLVQNVYENSVDLNVS